LKGGDERDGLREKKGGEGVVVKKKMKMKQMSSGQAGKKNAFLTRRFAIFISNSVDSVDK